MPAPEIAELDAHEDAALRAYWEVEQAAQLANDPHVAPRSLEALTNTMRAPSPYHRRLILVARDDAEIVGGAEVGWPTTDNPHLGGLEINVRPDRQRRGVGTALWRAAHERLVAEGRTSVIGELNVVGDDADSPGYAFATGLGFEPVHTEDHFVLPLPVPEGRVADLRTRVGTPPYDVVTWRNRCPDEHLAAYCRLRTQMSNDVPTGELDLSAVVVDEERVRSGEERLARSYDTIVAAARDGADLVAYTVMYLPRGGDFGHQDDTLVMPEHRGHRLGTLLKLTTLDLLARDHPERTSIHTWTALDNAAMQRTNRDFGFAPVDRLHEMQRREG